MKSRLREIAEKHAAPGSLLPDPSYCPRCGVPVQAGVAHAHYEDRGEVPKGRVPTRDPSPFRAR